MLDTYQGSMGPPEVSVWSYVNVILRRRYLVLGLPLILGAVTAVITIMKPRQYVAFASFVPHEGANLPSGFGQIATQFGLLSGRSNSNSPQFYAALLLSRDVLRNVITTRYSVAGFDGNLYKYFEIDGTDPERTFTDVVAKFLALVSVQADRATGVVRLSVRTRFPDLSRQVVRRFLEEVTAHNQRRRQASGRAEREFLDSRLTESKQGLTEAENAVARFYKSNRRYQDSPELVAEEARLQRQVLIHQQVYLTLNQSVEAAKIEEARNTPVITEVESPEGFVERRRRGAVRNTIVALLGGLVLAIGIAFLEEFVVRGREGQSGEYQEFLALGNQALSPFRRFIPGRRAR